MKKIITFWLMCVYVFSGLAGTFWIVEALTHLRYSFPVILFVIGFYVPTVICGGTLISNYLTKE